jgi:hypothetical protein
MLLNYLIGRPILKLVQVDQYHMFPSELEERSVLDRWLVTRLMSWSM